MHNTKALLPNVLILVVNALRVLLACCKNFSLTLLIHKNDVKTEPGYKTDVKEAILISNYTCMSTSLSFGFVFIRECFVMACYDVDYE